MPRLIASPFLLQSKVLKRAAFLIIRLETGILPNKGHALKLDHPETVNQRMLAFLKKDAISAK